MNIFTRQWTSQGMMKSELMPRLRYVRVVSFVIIGG
jgi:hypothetical protein